MNPDPASSANALALTSPAFKSFESIPADFTADGRNVSPPLIWTHVPPGTREFALLVEDSDPRLPEAFVHWIVYGIPPDARALPAGARVFGRFYRRVRLKQGMNSYGTLRYSGPLPPVGHGTHRYVFTLYALDTRLDLPRGADRARFLDAISDHVLETAQLVGSYAREVTLPEKKAG